VRIPNLQHVQFVTATIIGIFDRQHAEGVPLHNAGAVYSRVAPAVTATRKQVSIVAELLDSLPERTIGYLFLRVVQADALAIAPREVCHGIVTLTPVNCLEAAVEFRICFLD